MGQLLWVDGGAPNLWRSLSRSATEFQRCLNARVYAIQDSGLRGRKLFDDIRVLCAAPAYLEARGAPLMPGDLIDHDFLDWADLAPRDLIDEHGTLFKLDPKEMRCRMILDDGASHRAATLTGGGISINSLWNISHEIASGRLVHVLPDWRLIDHSELWLIYPRSNVLTPKVRSLMDFLIERLET